ncbi:MAG TPA: hypothetical protein VFS21_26350 [Roseiflexaceae bacterium]|nr:hypothetical protein [Roseiflexaceae bacterium]
MRVSTNRPRLRAVALWCWIAGILCASMAGRLIIPSVKGTLLFVCVHLLAALLLGLGVAFWLLGTDRRSGIIVDQKGLLLNLGHSASFIAWENIERIGVSVYRGDLYTLASRRQLGIALRDAQPYIQSYEQRLPAGRGFFAAGTRLIAWTLRPWARPSDAPLQATLDTNRAQTGYDVLVPEVFAGGNVEAFLREVADFQQRSPRLRAVLALQAAG